MIISLTTDFQLFLNAELTGYVWLVVEGWFVLSILWSISFILQLRIWALYNHSRIIGIFLISCSLVQVTVVSVFCGLGARDSRVEVERVGFLRRCKITTIPNFMTGFWISLLCLEAILCSLTLVKAIGHYLHTSCVRRERLRYVLLRDSLLYSLLSAAIYTYCLVNWLQNLADSLDATTGLAIAVPCVMAGRMMINIRKVYAETLTAVTQEEHELAIMFRDSAATTTTATLACI
ncbi:unnamed protein product [Cyclocybe aegerita]|uniref:Uncharacterized protein n=1 Tax=Cyclocybe aegerita TaxID=1973307 RepID=A0A8S0WRD1_CYCAE|nr:unnamed protein product [Cyclocybe aegerita]